MLLGLRISEVMSKVSEYDNNRVRLDDTAGITTDDLMRFQMHKTFYRLFTYSIYLFIYVL